MKKLTERVVDRWTRIVFGGILMGTGYILIRTGAKFIDNGVY